MKSYDLRIEDVKGNKFTIAGVTEYATDKLGGHLYYRRNGELKYIRFRKMEVFESIKRIRR